MESRFYFNIQFFKRFYGLLKLMFPRLWCDTTLLFFFLLCLLILEEFLVYRVGLIPSKYYTVLGNRDEYGFQNLTLMSLLLVAAIAVVKAAGNYTSSLLYVMWRKYIINYTHNLYFKDINFYSVNILDSSIDNPDQRITQDMNKMCQEFSDVIAKVIISPFKIAYYSYRAWTTAGYLGPVFVFSFFIVSTTLNKFLMSPVVNLVYQQEKKEGDLRFKHMQVRVNSEGIAFYRAGELEKHHSNVIYNKLLKTQQRLVLWEFPLNFAVNSASYFGSILSYIIVGIPIIFGNYDDLSPVDISALISQNSFFIMYLINCFTQLIALSLKVVDVAGTTHRVAELLENLRKQRHRQIIKIDKPHEENGGKEEEGGESMLVSSSLNLVSKSLNAQHLTFGPPWSSQVLIRDLDLQITPGCNLLVTGESGCGKSSLLRVISGLWTSYAGSVHWEISPKEVMFLPQKPYFTDGSLRTQINFPYNGTVHETTSCAINTEDKQIEDSLRLAGLWSLFERTGGLNPNVEWHWQDMLSPGEMQRLSFVRLFYHRPTFAVLDEATSQLDSGMEHKMYAKCQELGITLISIGHRESLEQYHHMRLHIKGNGHWSIDTLRL